jgi:hypothetical protein
MLLMGALIVAMLLAPLLVEQMANPGHSTLDVLQRHIPESSRGVVLVLERAVVPVAFGIILWFGASGVFSVVKDQLKAIFESIQR